MEDAMGKSREKYIHNVARTLMGRLGIRPYSMHYDPGLARTLYNAYGDQILRAIVPWSDEVRGRLACCGVGQDRNPHGSSRGPATLSEVGPPFSIHQMSGDLVVDELAMRAIVAAMTDLILAIWRENPRSPQH